MIQMHQPVMTRTELPTFADAVQRMPLAVVAAVAVAGNNDAAAVLRTSVVHPLEAPVAFAEAWEHALAQYFACLQDRREVLHQPLDRVDNSEAASQAELAA